MPRGLKIITAAVLIVLGVASMGLIWVRDSSRRPEYCAQCHVMDPYYSSWESSDYLAHEHAKFAIPCQTCHPRTMGESLREIVTYASGKYWLEEQKHPKEECLRCHEHGSYAEVIQRTKDYTVGDQKINPHDPHVGLQGMPQLVTQLECSDCHKMHKESPGVNYCYGCHHSRTFAKCTECHAQ